MTHAELVYRALSRVGPMSDWSLIHVVQGLAARECPKRGKPSSSSIRSRRAELTRAGRVYDTGRHERTPSGRAATIWRAR